MRWRFAQRPFTELKDFLNRAIKAGKREFELPQGIARKIHGDIIDGFNERFYNMIRFNFGCKSGDLISFGKARGHVAVNLENTEFFINMTDGLKKATFKTAPLNISIRLIQANGLKLPEVTNKNLIIFLGRDTKDLKKILANKIYLDYYTVLFAALHIRKHYLPGARSGLLQVIEWFTSRLYRELPFLFFDEEEFGRGSVTSNTALFLATLSGFREKEGHYYEIAQEMEKEIIKGSIIVGRKEMTKMPRLAYMTDSGKAIELQRASSTISELAPFIIYMKYILKKGDMLIFEEPEAHLHPGNQRLLAKYLARLIRNSVKLIITTHSDYLLEQISHFIQLGQISPAKRVRKYKIGKDDYLKSDEVSVHAFKYDKKSEGFKINKIAVHDEDGISQEEFNKVIDSLYDESVKIRRDLGIEK